jgi:hypothetical protein
LPKNSEISPGKKPLVPSSPPQKILGPPYVVHGMYQISGMYCTGALYQDSWDFHARKRQNVLVDTRNIHGLKFSTKFVAN